MGYLNALGVPAKKQNTLPASVHVTGVLAGAIAKTLETAEEGPKYDNLYNLMVVISGMILAEANKTI